MSLQSKLCTLGPGRNNINAVDFMYVKIQMTIMRTFVPVPHHHNLVRQYEEQGGLEIKHILILAIDS